MSTLLADCLLENKKILPEVFPGERSYDFLPAFLELIEVENSDETITLSCKYSLKSLGVVLPLIKKDKTKEYGFIGVHLERLARAIYETEAKKLKWKRSWIKVENKMQDWNGIYNETIAGVERDYQVAVRSLQEDHKRALEKQAKKGRVKLLDKFEKETQDLANEFLRQREKAIAHLNFYRIFTVRISPVDDFNLRTEIEQVIFAYATHDFQSKKLRESFFKGEYGDKRKKTLIDGIMQSLVQEGVLTSQGLPAKKISSLDDLRRHLTDRMGKGRWESCSYCKTPFYKILGRGQAKRKYCENPSCRTLAYRRRKHEKQKKGS